LQELRALIARWRQIEDELSKFGVQCAIGGDEIRWWTLTGLAGQMPIGNETSGQTSAAQ
jgi:hypothetical protein